ncbi:MAG TPA: TIGR03084 family metal-binding protein [Dehalococcoidia bacterium]|nr:TIGR03084 family metal-binding protein [Dehalococcoidia bacterium]
MTGAEEEGGDGLHSIIADLEAEQRALVELLEGLPEDAWDRPSPAEGWTLRDCVSHLAETDERAAEAVLAVPIPAGGTRREGVLTEGQLRARSLPPKAVLAWYRQAAAHLGEALRRLRPEDRPSWAGRPMGARSFISARIMEHWSHGLDIHDAAGIPPVDTDRLRHVAHLGVITRDFAFRNRGLTPPSEPFYVELTAPSGATWTWGPADARQRIAGPAGDFCRVVTQRIHPSDTRLVAVGEDALRFLEVAQAFAGPPGSGRAPRKRE